MSCLIMLYPNHDTSELSNRWFEKFKARHNIRSYRPFGESGSVDNEIRTEAIPRLRNVQDQYQCAHIYSMDEIGFFIGCKYVGIFFRISIYCK